VKKSASWYTSHVRSVRFATLAVAVVALAAPALANAALVEEPQQPAPSASVAPPNTVPKPTAVIVRIEGGFHPENRWLRYDGDGTARFEGILSERRGVFRSRIDYAKVEKVVADAELCTRDYPLVRPAGMDVFKFRVSVRCGAKWREFTTYQVSMPRTNEQVRQAARELEKLASTLKWEPTNETTPDPNLERPFRPAAVSAAP
jgi:hypothetical protein